MPFPTADHIYMEGGSHGDVYLCTAVIFREPYLYGGDILHTCPQREGIIAHKAGGNMGPLQIQNRVYNIHDSRRLYPRNTMDWRKIEYNGKDNIRGISPLPEDTKDDGKHLKKLLVVSFHRRNLQFGFKKKCLKKGEKYFTLSKLQ